jgi:hypothetical protein
MKREVHLSGTTFEKGFKRKHAVNNEPMEPPRELIPWWGLYAEWRNGGTAVSTDRDDVPPNVVKNRRVTASPNE